MGHPAWSREDRFGSTQGRSNSSDELDVLLAEWTAGYAPQDLVRMLQDAGIPAAIVSDASDLAKDPHMNARGFFIDLEHPVLGTIRSDSNPIRLSATPAHYEKTAPLLGEDNRHVFVELLGMDEERFKSLLHDCIIG